MKVSGRLPDSQKKASEKSGAIQYRDRNLGTVEDVPEDEGPQKEGNKTGKMEGSPFKVKGKKTPEKDGGPVEEIQDSAEAPPIEKDLSGHYSENPFSPQHSWPSKDLRP